MTKGKLAAIAADETDVPDAEIMKVADVVCKARPDSGKMTEPSALVIFRTVNDAAFKAAVLSCAEMLEARVVGEAIREAVRPETTKVACTVLIVPLKEGDLQANALVDPVPEVMYEAAIVEHCVQADEVPPLEKELTVHVAHTPF